MTHTLIIGDRTYSSWSLRGWLLFRNFGLTCNVEQVSFAAASVADQMRHPPARTVPTVVADDGSVWWDSLTIAEELATRHPDAGHWPSDSVARAAARNLVAEMHSGFSTLRSECPMNLAVAYSGFVTSDAVLADLRRIETLWRFAKTSFGQGGPWLFGAYTSADAFFAPVAARIATYGLPVSDASAVYVQSHLADSAFQEWRAAGLATDTVLPWYAMDLPTRAWPGPA